MRSVDKENVQEEHCPLGVVGFRDQQIIWESGVDNGMGSPTREEIVAQCDDRVFSTGPDIA